MARKQDIVGVCFQEETFYISEVSLTSVATMSSFFYLSSVSNTSAVKRQFNEMSFPLSLMLSS